jgi:hypothetical protein
VLDEGVLIHHPIDVPAGDVTACLRGYKETTVTIDPPKNQRLNNPWETRGGVAQTITRKGISCKRAVSGVVL